jgi:NADPH:quinone reductase-like Zn-dependent oxidoreductase
MKAILHLKYGSPDVLILKKIEKPTPKNNDLLVKVYATTVNRTDCAMLRAKPFIMRFITGLFKPKNPILGTDFAGEIEAVGNQITKFKTGDKVFGFDDMGLGSHAQYMTISENNAIATIPENTSYAQAAASIEGAHYAYNFINKVEIKSGQKVMVNGATGAIGSAAVQLLKYLGAIVTAVCDGQNTELVKSIGADKVIDYTKMDFTKTNEKYHYVFDAVGKSSFLKCKPLLEAGGVYISSELGFMSQNLFLPLFTAIFGKKKVKFPFPNNRKRSVLLIKKLLQEGKFNSVIDKSYPMEKIAEAFRYAQSGQKIGNIIITFE